MDATIATATPTQHSADDIAALKRNWLNDPCWDIEDTEGFEAHHDELLSYRLELEAERERSFERKLLAKAAALGIPGNVAFASVIYHLEQRIRDFERRVSELEGVSK